MVFFIEMFDNSRLRFKRPTTSRSRDAALPADIDPYRIDYGMSESVLALWIVGAIVLAMGIFFAVMMILNP